jgi:hypothetical protein
MNGPSQGSLGGFEERLLVELRDVVAEGVSAAPHSPRPAHTGARRLKRRPMLAFAAALAAGLAVAALAGLPLGGNAGDRAWAVTNNADGSVTVEIDSLRDADGLQRQLNLAGVPAVVQYIPPGKTCADEASPGTHEGGGSALHGAATGSVDRHGRRESSSLEIRKQPDGGIEFTFDAGAHPNETLVIRSEGLAPGQAPVSHPAAADERSAIRVSHMTGEARPCRLVNSLTR